MPASIAVADFNGDGRPDLATANIGPNVDPIPGTVSILLGRGDSTFQAAQDFGVGVNPAQVSVGYFNGDGRPDLVTTNAFSSTVSILINNTAGVVVNNLVTFVPIPDTFAFTPDPTGCPIGFVGTFRFAARLTNVSERSLSNLLVAVTRITQFNLLQNADGAPGSVGARLTVPRRDGFNEGILSSKEFVDVPFIICLTQRRPFQFFVDVLGIVDASIVAQAKAQLGRQVGKGQKVSHK